MDNKEWLLKDFDYDLPEPLIAAHPLLERDSSRLMIVERDTGGILHRKFSDIAGFLKKGDLLVLNDTKVMPARLFGTRPAGGAVEVLAVRRQNLPKDAGGDGEKEAWICLARPAKGLKKGVIITFDGGIQAEVLGRTDEGFFVLDFGLAHDFLEKIGHVPLPPYIKRADTPDDRVRYQTVFAKNIGAVASPTAGLHFTDGLLKEIKEKGVEPCFITLHTGPGTFMPVRSDLISEHSMHPEYYSITRDCFDGILRAKKEGRRIIATGSTSLRALEASVLDGFASPRLNGFTGLFIYPGFSFRLVDALITNFHLPRSTLLMLVSAFAGRPLVMRAYMEAIKERYRFYSFGDAMFFV